MAADLEQFRFAAFSFEPIHATDKKSGIRWQRLAYSRNYAIFA